jgi:hypothetical protein
MRLWLNMILWTKLRATKHFLQSIFTYYDICMDHLFTVICGLMSILFSHYIFHVCLNMICTSINLQQQNEHLSTYFSKFYETKALTSTFNKNLAELFNHMYDLWPQTSDPSTGTRGYSWIRVPPVHGS